MVFEYMEGGDLQKFIREHHKEGMPIDMVLSFTEQLLQATKFMHDQLIIHRDIKSANILLGAPGSLPRKNGEPSEFDRTLKLADYGLSRVIAVPPKQMSREMGTLNWRAPEVILENLTYSQGVDMWSIGVVIY